MGKGQSTPIQSTPNNSTNIANGFPEEIRASVTANKQVIKREQHEGQGEFKTSGSVGVSAHGLKEFEYENFQQTSGYALIARFDSLNFDVEGVDGQVSVSIIAGTRKICDNFPVRNGCDIIIDANGYIKIAKPGERWIDESGKDHRIFDVASLMEVLNRRLDKEDKEAEAKKQKYRHAF